MTVALGPVTDRHMQETISDVADHVCAMLSMAQTPLITSVVREAVTYALVESYRSDSMFSPVSGIGYADPIVKLCAYHVASYLQHEYLLGHFFNDWERGVFRRILNLTELSRMVPAR